MRTFSSRTQSAQWQQLEKEVKIESMLLFPCLVSSSPSVSRRSSNILMNNFVVKFLLFSYHVYPASVCLDFNPFVLF